MNNFQKSQANKILSCYSNVEDILEKAVYIDNHKNRKLGRVGQEYSGKANESDNSFEHSRKMAGYYGVKEKEALDSGDNFNSSSDPELRKEAKKYYDQAKKYGEKSNKYMKRARKLFNATIHGNWNSTTPSDIEAKKYGSKKV